MFNIVERRVMITLRSPEVPAGWSAVPHYEPVVADAHTPIPKAAPPQLVSYAFHMPQLLDAWLTGWHTCSVGLRRRCPKRFLHEDLLRALGAPL